MTATINRMPPPTARVRKEHLDGLAISLLLACSIFWGAQQVLMKATLSEMPPVTQASLRFIGSTIVLLVWSRLRGVPLFERDGSLVPGLAAGFLFAIEFALMFIGMQFTNASRLTLFVYAAPFWVALVLPLFVKAETLRPLQWFGLACAFGGMAIALREGWMGAGLGATWRGDLIALASGLMWGLTTVTIRATVLGRISAEKLLFYQVGVSALVLPFVALALGEPLRLSFSAFGWGSLALQALIGSFASYLAWMWVLGRYPATLASVFVFLTPITAFVVGALALGEPITPSLVLALALVGIGIVLVNRKRPPKPQPA